MAIIPKTIYKFNAVHFQHNTNPERSSVSYENTHTPREENKTNKIRCLKLSWIIKWIAGGISSLILKLYYRAIAIKRMTLVQNKNKTKHPDILISGIKLKTQT